MCWKSAWPKLYRPGASSTSCTSDAVGRGFEDVEQRIHRDPGGPLQDVEIEVPPDDGRGRQHLFGIGPQPHDPAADHLADALGESGSVDGAIWPPNGRPVLVDGAGVAQVAQHLGHEERVPVGLTVHRVGQTQAERIEALAGHRFEQ